jgi:hypothetical protein
MPLFFSGASSKRKQITSAIAPLVDLARSHGDNVAGIWLQVLAYVSWGSVDFWLVRHETSPFRKLKGLTDAGVRRFAAVVVADLLVRFLASERNRRFVKDVHEAVAVDLPASALNVMDPLARSYFERFSREMNTGDLQTSLQFYLALTTTGPIMYEDILSAASDGHDLGPMYDPLAGIQVPVFQSGHYKTLMATLQAALNAPPEQAREVDFFRGYEPKRLW